MTQPAAGTAPVAAFRPTRSMRSDIETMLMPLFPEDAEHSHAVHIGGVSYTLYTTDPAVGLARPADRRVINLLAARVADLIHAGEPPTRHLRIGVKDLLEAISGESTGGGSDYARITERLHRLAATRIRTEGESPLGPDVDRIRDFAWIDAWQQDIQQYGQRARVLAIMISLSEDALSWILHAQGFMVSKDTFADLSSVSSSAFRIYEICLAQLLSHGGSEAFIQMDELRRRIPMSSDLKTFKSRTLRRALDAIAHHTPMNRCLTLSLRRRDGDRFDRIDFSQRARHADVYIGIARGPDAPRNIDRLSRLLEGTAMADRKPP